MTTWNDREEWPPVKREPARSWIGLGGRALRSETNIRITWAAIGFVAGCWFMAIGLWLVKGGH